MKTIYTLTKNNLRILVLKKPGYTFMMIAFPVIISVFLSTFLSSGNSPIKVGVVDNSKTISSERIINNIKANGTMDVLYNNNEEDIDRSFSSKDINVALIIDEDFEDKLLKGDSSGVLIKGIEDENLYKLVSTLVGSEVANLKKLGAINNGELNGYKISLERYKSNSIEISKESLNDLYGDYAESQTLIGFLVMFAFFRSMSGASLISEDKEQHLYTRILASPAKVWQYFFSNIISILILLLVQVAFSVIGINIVTDINFGMSGASLFMVLSCIAVVAVSIGTFCIAVTENSDLSSIIGNILLMTFLFLGGCVVPVNMISDFVNKISYFTPTRWAMEAISSLQQGEAMTNVLANVGVLLLFGLAFFITAIYCISRRDRVDNLR